MSQSKEVAIIGGGLVGSLCACFLANRNYTVNVYEKREDIRRVTMEPGKSINLAMSNRARKALRTVGLEDIILKCAVPMKGRLIHDPLGNTQFIPYDAIKKQCLYSVSRNHLNGVLLTAAENNPNVNIFFQHELVDMDLKEGVVELKNLKTQEIISESCDFIIGADGAHSSLRKQIQHQNLFSFSQKYIEHGYVELIIKTNNGKSMHANSLHIWPRRTFMMIALPNLDTSWTVTLFMPFQKFDDLKDSNSVLQFFRSTFPDAISLLDEEQIIQQLISKRPRSLVSVSCDPYHFADKVLLIGDAAHAMVPFYGQGMNAGFEDCSILNDILEYNDDDIARSVREFTLLRREDAHAICELTMYNYEEMRDLVTTKSYRLRKSIDEILYSIMPQTWIPLYISVTFSDMGYKNCMINRQWQDKVIWKAAIFLVVVGILVGWMIYHEV